jgi:uncharacterized protein with von Willebrand factor type A (vWA) domain
MLATFQESKRTRAANKDLTKVIDASEQADETIDKKIEELEKQLEEQEKKNATNLEASVAKLLLEQVAC